MRCQTGHWLTLKRHDELTVTKNPNRYIGHLSHCPYKRKAKKARPVTAHLVAPQLICYNQAGTESAMVGVVIAVGSSGKSAKTARTRSLIVPGRMRQWFFHELELGVEGKLSMLNE